MEFTPQQNERLLEKLDTLLKGTRCAICGSSRFKVGEQFSELRIYARGSMVVGGGVTPLAAVTCAKCGNVLLFNAIEIGLIDPKTGDWVDG